MKSVENVQSSKKNPDGFCKSGIRSGLYRQYWESIKTIKSSLFF